MPDIKIPMYNPLIETEEINRAVEALEMKWLGMGAYVKTFEEEVLNYLQCSKYSCAVSTGHAALHLALLLCDIKAGDEVITPAFNNIADFQAILAVGASPVFCDIDEKSLCINPDKIEELITDKTKAIMPMDYGSAICAHDQIKKIADKHNLRVIHDAAHSFGSSYNGKKIGTFSDICMFSFDPVKNITCIDGGMLIVNSEEDLKKLHEMRLIGMGQPAKTMYENKRAWTYDVKSLGFRYHMPNLHAAIGIEQLKKIESISESKREVALNYNKSFAKISNLKIPSNPISNSCPFLYYILCSKELRNKLRDYLLNRGVETGIHWQPAYNFSLFENYRAGDLSVTKLIEHEIVSIPIHSQMKYEDYTYVITCIEEFFKDKS